MNTLTKRFFLPITMIACLLTLSVAARAQDAGGDPLQSTARLEWEGDIASRMIDGIDTFLLEQIDEASKRRIEFWRDCPAEGDERAAFMREKRKVLGYQLGLNDQRVPFGAPHVIHELGTTPEIAICDEFTVSAIRWPTVGGIWAEGLLLTPRHREPVGTIIALSDADTRAEHLLWGTEASQSTTPFAGFYAHNGFRVVIPYLLSREMSKRNGRANLTHREYIYRSAFELGRHVIGYELQACLALVDWLDAEAPDRPIGVMGAGEGGMLALFAGALDERIDAISVSGYFGPREEMWQHPLDRNVFGLLEQFGDAELTMMIAPRLLVIDAAIGPEVTLPSEGGAPARLQGPPPEDVRQEIARIESLGTEIGVHPRMHVVFPHEDAEASVTLDAVGIMAAELTNSRLEDWSWGPDVDEIEVVRDLDANARQTRLLSQYDRHNQEVLRESPYVRQEFMASLNTDSLDAFVDSQTSFRQRFANETIGTFDMERLPFSARSRLVYDEPAWKGYEVVLDVFPNVFAYGILLVPNGIEEHEQRPVVVCQHGLEGRPQDIVTGDHRAYHDFAAKLAERGFVTFAPQNIYIFGDRFRTLQRKANPLKKTLFSIMVPQHQQIVDWLQTLPFVDDERIAFYGLSYGGKSAMRIPPLVEDYCLSICSADFNEWVWKNASTRSRYSYVWTGEYEIFEYDLGSTFNYAEMAALIAPRPFMVERGHFDGVASDEAVAYEFAKVRHLYAAQLGIGDRCEIEWFVGPHTINGEGTFSFLHRHLGWPEPQ